MQKQIEIGYNNLILKCLWPFPLLEVIWIKVVILSHISFILKVKVLTVTSFKGNAPKTPKNGFASESRLNVKTISVRLLLHKQFFVNGITIKIFLDICGYRDMVLKYRVLASKSII